MFVTQLMVNDVDISRAETDTEAAKHGMANMFSMFKSFDVNQTPNMSKYVPTMDNDTSDTYKREDEKLSDIKVEEQRLLGQQKSLMMELEDVSFTVTMHARITLGSVCVCAASDKFHNIINMQNEIRTIAKEQILNEKIDEQTLCIDKLNEQIHEIKRKLGILPSASSRRQSVGVRSLMPSQKSIRNVVAAGADILILSDGK